MNQINKTKLYTEINIQTLYKKVYDYLIENSPVVVNNYSSGIGKLTPYNSIVHLVIDRLLSLNDMDWVVYDSIYTLNQKDDNGEFFIKMSKSFDKIFKKIYNGQSIHCYNLSEEMVLYTLIKIWSDIDFQKDMLEVLYEIFNEQELLLLYEEFSKIFKSMFDNYHDIHEHDIEIYVWNSKNLGDLLEDKELWFGNPFSRPNSNLNIIDNYLNEKKSDNEESYKFLYEISEYKENEFYIKFNDIFKLKKYSPSTIKQYTEKIKQCTKYGEKLFKNTEFLYNKDLILFHLKDPKSLLNIIKEQPKIEYDLYLKHIEYNNVEYYKIGYTKNNNTRDFYLKLDGVTIKKDIIIKKVLCQLSDIQIIENNIKHDMISNEKIYQGIGKEYFDIKSSLFEIDKIITINIQKFKLKIVTCL